MKYYLPLLALFFHVSIFAQQDKKSDTLQQIFQSLSTAQTNHDDLRIIKEANNLGDFYFSRDDSTNALQYYETAFSTAKRINHHTLMGESLNNMGEVYQFQSDYKKAINTFSRASEMYTKAGNDALIATTLNLLGKATLLSKNYKKSYEIFESANSKARKSDNQQAIVDSYRGIAEALEQMGSLKYAAHYSKLYTEAKAKLEESNGVETASAVDIIPGKGVTSKSSTDKKPIIEKPQIKTVRSVTNSVDPTIMFVLFGLVLLAIAITIWWTKKSMRNLKVRIDAEHAERDAVQQDRLRTLLSIRDDLYTGLSKINTLSSTISATTGDLHIVRSKCESVQDTTRKMNENIKDLIWAMTPEDTTVATLLSHIREYTNNYFAVYPIAVAFDFPASPSDIPITKENYRALVVTVKEAFHNIVKHSKATEVVVKAGVNDDYFSISIIDNGEGFDSSTTKGDGIANMQSRFEKIGGKFKLFSKPLHGSHITIGLPLRKVFSS